MPASIEHLLDTNQRQETLSAISEAMVGMCKWRSDYEAAHSPIPFCETGIVLKQVQAHA